MDFLQQLFTNLWDYIKSPEFTAILASVLLVLKCVQPFISKWLNAKANVKYNNVIKACENKDQIIANLEKNADKYKAEYELQKTLLVNFMQQTQEMLKSYQEAAMLAYNSSNLKADVKMEIKKILEEPVSVDQPKLEENTENVAIEEEAKAEVSEEKQEEKALKRNF